MENQNYALGLIETIGYPALIAAADAACKAADVKVVTYQGADAGLVTIYIVGDVGSVQAAVLIGKEAAEQVGRLHHYHVIARPDENVKKMIFQILSDEKDKNIEKKIDEKEEQPKKQVTKEISQSKAIDNNSVDLQKSNVQELRKIAGNVKKFPLTAEQIQSAKREELIKHLSATQVGKGGDN